MDSLHFLFAVPGGAGHIYSALGLVEALVGEGHRATVVTGAAFAEDVANAGGEFAPYPTAFDTFHVPDAMEKPNAEELLHGVYVEDNELMLRAIEGVAAADMPDAVVYDEFHFIAGKLLCTKLSRPGVRLSGIASNDTYSFWDALRKSHGHGNPDDFPKIHQQLRDLIDEAGRDLPVRAFWEEIDDCNLVFIPRTFQPCGSTFDGRFHFIGPSLPAAQRESHWEPPAGDPPILVVSLGSTWNEHPEFFTDCADAFKDTPWHVVLAIGEHLDPSTLGELPANVEAHSWISFLDVLQYAKAFITQGTTGALMATLARGCPSLICSHFASEAEPTANRALEIGVSHPLSIEDLGPDRLREVVARLVADQAVKERVGELREELVEAGGARRGASAIVEHAVASVGRRPAQHAPAAFNEARA
ncbi:MAG: macrolide family glycosyltransferase [Pseudomonadota bacterium]